LARLLRVGELTAVWVPDEGQEAMRDLVRAREVAVDDLRRNWQAISSLLLKRGRVFSGKTTWGAVHVRWMQEKSFTHPAQQIVLQEMVLAERHARERLARIEVAIANCCRAGHWHRSWTRCRRCEESAW
jgi:transposase